MEVEHDTGPEASAGSALSSAFFPEASPML
jgi:hypothetical protein